MSNMRQKIAFLFSLLDFLPGLPKNRGYGAPKVQWRSEREDTWPSALASGYVAWQNWATSVHEIMGEECA